MSHTFTITVGDDEAPTLRERYRLSDPWGAQKERLPEYWHPLKSPTKITSSPILASPPPWIDSAQRY